MLLVFLDSGCNEYAFFSREKLFRLVKMFRILFCRTKKDLRFQTGDILLESFFETLNGSTLNIFLKFFVSLGKHFFALVKYAQQWYSRYFESCT